MAILVVGGAGYIGSHMCLLLREAAEEVIILDNLSTGVRKFTKGYTFYENDLHDVDTLDKIFTTHQIDAVMHFAAFIEVGESVKDPAKYYRNNVCATQALLDSMLKHDIKKFIFSSTAAIFGMPEYVPIDEEHPKNPINPYGRSKLIVEQMLDDYDEAYGLKSVCLRYFNAAGADPQGRVGECHDPETHLIPLVLQAASGRRKSISIFGDDYDTPDGTCIRDYIHVNDLCVAHLLALNKLRSFSESMKFNLGNGNGYSVREVISAAMRVTDVSFRVDNMDRREGDPDKLIANSLLVEDILHWKPKRFELDQIIKDAWEWEKYWQMIILNFQKK